MYITHAVGVHLPHNTGCKKCHSTETSSELSLTTTMRCPISGITGVLFPFPGWSGSPWGRHRPEASEKRLLVFRALRSPAFLLASTPRPPASLLWPLRRYPPHLAPDAGPGDGAPGGGTDSSFGYYASLCCRQLRLRAPSCGYIWEVFLMREPSQRLHPDYLSIRLRSQPRTRV